MILAIDAGNTNIVLGCLEEDGSLRFTARVSTDRGKTMDEYALILRSLFDLHGIDRRGLEGAILASVVSELTEVLRTAVELVIHKAPIVVGAGIKTGVNIKIDDPGQLGADLVVAPWRPRPSIKNPSSSLIWAPPPPCPLSTNPAIISAAPSSPDLRFPWTP